MQIPHSVMPCAGLAVSPVSDWVGGYWTSLTLAPGFGSAPPP